MREAVQRCARLLGAASDTPGLGVAPDAVLLGEAAAALRGARERAPALCDLLVTTLGALPGPDRRRGALRYPLATCLATALAAIFSALGNSSIAGLFGAPTTMAFLTLIPGSVALAITTKILRHDRNERDRGGRKLALELAHVLAKGGLAVRAARVVGAYVALGDAARDPDLGTTTDLAVSYALSLGRQAGPGADAGAAWLAAGAVACAAATAVAHYGVYYGVVMFGAS